MINIDKEKTLSIVLIYHSMEMIYLLLNWRNFRKNSIIILL